MKCLNQIQLIGNAGADPEKKFTPQGKAVCTFSLATSEKWSGDDGKVKESTQWHRIVCWEKLAETVNQYLEKGKAVFVQGKVQYREWLDTQGEEHKTTEIRADQVIFLGSSKQAGANPAPAQPAL